MRSHLNQIRYAEAEAVTTEKSVKRMLYSEASVSSLLYFSYKCFYKILSFLPRFIMVKIVRTYLRLRGVQIKRNLRVYSFPLCRRHFSATIKIGSNVTIFNKLSENPAGISHRSVLIASKPGARLIIGDNVGMSGVVLDCTKEIVLEDFVYLGAGVMVYDTDFHPINFSDRRVKDKSKIKSAPVRICEDAWIGARTIILKGVTIGPRAVVGAGSVVTRDIPADCIAAGVPAKFVKPI
jgi:acetyltransferase-like isoleucine patch superfamily enzyme